MVTTESEKKFHKQKAVDALERMKKAVDREDLKDADREEDTADHHLGEMAQLKSDEEDKSWKRKSLPPSRKYLVLISYLTSTLIVEYSCTFVESFLAEW
jgi:hypothetical protein